MSKFDILYTKNILYINVFGCFSCEDILNLKKKMYYIVREYGINDIVINLKDITVIDKVEFYNFVDDYGKNYGGKLEVLEK